MKYEFKHTSETKAFFDSTVLGKDPITEIVLEGEPGCGKTLATRWLAEELQVAYLRFVCTKETSFFDFTTEKIIKKGDIVEQDSAFLKMVQEPSVINVDECYLAQPDVMAGLNSLLDYDRAITLPSGRTIKRHARNFIIFTSNPKTYAGVKRQHGGFIDRLPTLEVGYLTPAKEVELVLKSFPACEKEQVARIVKFASLIRQGRRAGRMNTVCSTRGLLTMAQLMTNGATLELAVSSTLKVPDEEKKTINELMLKSLEATLIKNDTTGEDELVLNDSLKKEVEELKTKLATKEEAEKAWKLKTETLLEALK